MVKLEKILDDATRKKSENPQPKEFFYDGIDGKENEPYEFN